MVATGRRPAVVARVARISRQAIYRPPVKRPLGAGPGRVGPDDARIVEVAKNNPTDGTRMVAALASRELGTPVNRKRAQRVMRAYKLLQRSRNEARRRRPGYFRVRRPDELRHMDMTKVWTASHGWVYLHAIVDCCTREIAGWSLDLRCRDDEGIEVVEGAALARGVASGQLTLGTDNGSQFTSRDFRKHLSARGITHRRGGYRDPESQAFIESWFGQFKKRCAWRSRVGEHRPGEEGGRELHRSLPRKAPFEPCLQKPGGGGRHVGGSGRPTNQSDLRCQRGRGPRHSLPMTSPR